jgi:hypothetical protein
MVRHKMRLWGLEWCGICVEEIGRAGISEQKKYVHPFPRRADYQARPA